MKDISLGSQSLMKLNANNKAHMYKVLCHEGQHIALVGQTRGVVKLWRFLLIKNPRHISRESKDSSIKSYLTSPQLNNYGFPKI